MFAQAIASVFSTHGVLIPRHYRTSPVISEEKIPIVSQIRQEAAVVELSPEARRILAAQKQPEAAEEGKPEEGAKKGQQRELNEEDKKEVEELKKTDSKVRAHEQAHVAAAGRYARGGAQFEYKKGPDGRQYAVSGHVSIDSSPVPNDPEATVQKARVVIRAALAPADPSAADRSVAAKASRMEAQARMEKMKERKQERTSEANGEEPEETGGASATPSTPGAETLSSSQMENRHGYGQFTGQSLGKLLDVAA